MKSEKYADLHMHTTASDGTDSIQERIEQAEEYGLDAIAITDHDKINEELEQRSFTADNGVEVITGIEIKCEVDGTKIEILGVFIDPEDTGINDLIGRLSENRIERMEEMVNRLNSHIDEEIKLKDVLSHEEETPGRPHLAEALVEKGIAEDMEHGFDEFIGSDSEAYVEVDKVPAKDAIKAIHNSGGAAVLAHPGRSLEKEDAVEKIGKLVRCDLDGIEVQYTYRQKVRRNSFTVHFTEVHANKIAELYDLVPTGGSDCHGLRSDKFNIGKVKMDYEKVTRLKALSEEYR